MLHQIAEREDANRGHVPNGTDAERGSSKLPAMVLFSERYGGLSYSVGQDWVLAAVLERLW